MNTGSYYNQTLKKLEIGLRYESNKGKFQVEVSQQEKLS